MQAAVPEGQEWYEAGTKLHGMNGPRRPKTLVCVGLGFRTPRGPLTKPHLAVPKHSFYIGLCCPDPNRNENIEGLPQCGECSGSRLVCFQNQRASAGQGTVNEDWTAEPQEKSTIFF